MLQAIEELRGRRHRKHARVPFGHDHAVLMDGISGVRRNHGVARANHREEQMGQGVLGADGDNRFGFRIQLDAVFGAIALHDFRAQPGNAARHRVTMIARIADRFDQFLDDRLGRGAIRIAHAEVHHILLRRARLGLHLVDDGEHVGRQFLDAVKLVARSGSWLKP